MPTLPTLYGRPGVYVQEQLIGPTPPNTNASPSTAGFIGQHWRGPTSKSYLCNSWFDFVRYYGGFAPATAPTLANPYLPYAVYEYFLNGGQQAWIQRVTASATPGATASTIFKDTAATPQNTLSLTAGLFGIPGNVGTWGNSLFADVTASVQNVGRFQINIYNGGYGAAFLVETWLDLSMNPQDPRYVPALLNSPTNGSVWVVAQDLNSPSAPPNDMPATVAGRQFTGGTDTVDPSVVDRTTALTYNTSNFDAVPNVLNFNLPGESNTLVLTAAITYAQTRPFSFCIMDPPSGQTPAGAISFFQSLGPVSSYAAMYYPWLTCTNPASSNLRATILLPPGGTVMGQMVTVDSNQGVWWAPAGLKTILAGVAAAERQFAPQDLSALNLANVNALRTRPNGEVVIWGARTMQQGFASLYVPVRRTLNYIEASLAQQLEYIVFDPNDSMTWAVVINTCDQFLSGLYNRHAFPGNSVAQSYYVICDQTNNPLAQIDQGILAVTVGLALLYPAEFIALTIQQFQTDGTTTITATA